MSIWYLSNSESLENIDKANVTLSPCRSVEETLRLVQAFQHTDKYGEVCPANWKPGSKTIKPDSKAAQEYFVDAN